jgi:transposase
VEVTNRGNKMYISFVGRYLTPFQRQILEQNLQDEISESNRQRIQIMLMTDEGKAQLEICDALGCCPATARHWMHIARIGMINQWQECPVGRPKAVNDRYIQRLKELLNQTPRENGYCFSRWTAAWLCKHLAKELGIEVSERHLKRIMKQMGLSTVKKVRNQDFSPSSRSQEFSPCCV